MSLRQDQGPTSGSNSEYRGCALPAYRFKLAADRTSFAPETT
jgi:hypothetical protein